MTSIAVVILNYNGEKLLPKFLPSVVQHSGDARVIVVDNGSTDSSLLVVQQSFPQVELIRLEKNLGFCGGYNLAINRINFEIVVLLNSDVEVTPGWLESPVKLLRSNHNIAAVQPKILSYSNKNQFEYAGAAGGFIDWLGYPLCRGRIFQTVETDEGQYNDQCPIFWASGACMMIKRQKYLEAGGLDEDFFAHMEEIDLCWRLNRLGYSVYFDGNSTIFHLGGGTLSAASPRKVYYNFRNGLSLLIKNYSTTGLLFRLPIRILLDWVSVLFFLARGSFQNSAAVARAHLHVMRFLRRDLSKRWQFGKVGYKISRQLVVRKAAVIQYFILGRRSYSQIKSPK